MLTDAPGVMSISVSDTGIGIAREHERRIFEAFVQGDGTTARIYGGTGLGLSISRELAGLLGGEITVLSTVGEGTTFTVFLPLAEPPAPAPSFSAGFAPRPAVDRDVRLGDDVFMGLKVLVVDDDFRNVFALTALLERGHADVTVAESGPEALAALERVPGIDVVLMDIMMPAMDGYAAMRAIRARDRFADVPILAVTSKVVAGERERCIAAGANGYLPKPVDTAELLAALGPWLPVKAPAS